MRHVCTVPGQRVGSVVEKLKLPPRGASAQQRQGVALGAVVLSEADHALTMEELERRQGGE